MNCLDLAVFKVCILPTTISCFQVNYLGNNVIKMAFELSPEGGKSYSKGLIACVMAQSCQKSSGVEEVDWIFAFSHRFICWNSSPSGMVFGGRDFSDSGSFCSILKYFYERLCPWSWLPHQFWLTSFFPPLIFVNSVWSWFSLPLLSQPSKQELFFLTYFSVFVALCYDWVCCMWMLRKSEW